MGRQALALLRQTGGRLQQRRRAGRRHHHPRHPPHAELLTSHPGLGSLTGARVVAELGDDRSRFADARAVKAYAAAAPLTPGQRQEPPGQPPPRQEPTPGRRRLLLGFSALTASPGARARYDNAAGDGHIAAQRNLFNRLLGCLHHCLQTRTRYNEQAAFPTQSATAA
jgi:hypothetical protein